jgi:hypothetical protein
MGKSYQLKEEEWSLKYPLSSKYNRLSPLKPDYPEPDYYNNLPSEKPLRT